MTPEYLLRTENTIGSHIQMRAGNERYVMTEICTGDTSYLEMYIQDYLLHFTRRDLFHKHIFLRIVLPKVHSFCSSW